MEKPSTETQTRTIHDRFGRFAATINSWLGSTWAFLAAGLSVVLGSLAGQYFHFLPAWFQVSAVGTNLACVLMVFLIQNTQNRDAGAMNLKLNELIRAADKARNHMIDIERLSDLELDEMQATYERIKSKWTERQMRNPRKTEKDEMQDA